MEFEVTITGAEILHKKMLRFSRKGAEAFSDEARDAVYELRDKIREAAPRDTGEYADSIDVYEMSRGLGLFMVDRILTIATWHPAALRLEYGFVGRDSLGRLYNQAPDPHWRPVLWNLAPELAPRLLGQVKLAWS